MTVRNKNWIVTTFNSSGDNTIISGVSGQRIFLKHVILTVDSETDLYFKSSNDRVLTCTFQFGSFGALHNLDTALDILLAPGLDLEINSTNAVNGSIMVDYQMVTDNT